MQISITSVVALIIWYETALRSINSLGDTETREDPPPEEQDSLAEKITIAKSIDAERLEVQGDLLRPIIRFRPDMSKMLDRLLDTQELNQQRLRLRAVEIENRNDQNSFLMKVVRHFLRGIKDRHDRLSLPEGDLLLASIATPTTSKISEWLRMGNQLLFAERNFLQLGYPAMMNPSAEELGKAINAADLAASNAQKASTDVLDAQRKLGVVREESLALVRKIGGYLDYYYSDLPKEQRRNIKRSLGYLFAPRAAKEVGEEDDFQNDGTGTPEPDANETSTGEPGAENPTN